MIPTKFPVIEKTDIIIGEYHDWAAKKNSIIGWIKELFLYRYYDKESFQILPEDRKDYEDVLIKLREIAGLSKNRDLETWEESLSINEAVTVLNKLRRKLGYVHLTNR